MLQDQDRISIVRYRIDNAHRTIDEVATHLVNGFYNTAVNRMYYACYYVASSILVANKIVTKSHDGVKQMFSLHFVKTGLVPKDFGRFYNNLFEKRGTGDYEDLFDHDLATCEEYYPRAKEFIDAIEKLVQQWLNEQEINKGSNTNIEP